ncbi:hypothetical protein Goklo_012888 [Gossypium klotzschianum]|uniref:NB-ARC domain-containing protein n=1 Tax=Gossypium klotzschianum TaxID=34286 RepID=A0A7J8VEI0_9ROSI|nr:hypothetical protein [Gossypium klotzschianum]
MKEFLDKAPNASEALAMDGPSGELPLPTSELVGEEAVRKEIWECLMQEKVSKIGVWGMGGVGKTTIMKHIHNDLLKQQRFEMVIWVTISKEFNVMKIQDNIASALESKECLDKEEDELRRAAILSEILKKAGKHVLIRVAAMAASCLPLTIVVVAGTMKGEDNPHIWKNALKELKERIGKVEGVEAEVMERLKFSFDHLKDGKVKDCFLIEEVDLFRTEIEEVPEGMDMLINLRYLDLKVSALKEIPARLLPARLLPKLVHLQHLSFDVKNKKVSLKAEEMEPLKKLECFKGHFEDINEFNKFISSMQQSELIMLPIDIQELNIVECHYLRSFVDDDNSSFKNAIDLRICRIWFCEGIECVVSLSSFASPSSHPFQSLEVLDLQFLPKLSYQI